MSALSDLLLNTAPYVVQLQMIEITHSAFSTTRRVCRNCPLVGIQVIHEGPTGSISYVYLPMKIRMVGSANDLDQSMEVTLGDLGEILPTELALVAAANKLDEKPIVKYREYRSDDLTAPVYGPLVFEVNSVAFNTTGCVLKCKAAVFNQGRVGVYYIDEIFPMLKNVK